MVIASFVSQRDIRGLRDLTPGAAPSWSGRSAQRLEKELEDAGIKFSAILSDVADTSGRAILNALMAGSVIPVGRARTKIPALVEALDGEFTDHHAFMLRHYLKTDYRELDADHFTRRDPERAMRRMLKEADSLGLAIRFDPITA
jgi:hypothetical protein